MEIKKKVIMRTVCNENILVPAGECAAEYNGIFSLSETGAELFSLIEKGRGKDELINYLKEEYGTDTDTAREDVENFLSLLEGYGII